MATYSSCSKQASQVLRFAAIGRHLLKRSFQEEPTIVIPIRPGKILTLFDRNILCGKTSGTLIPVLECRFVLSDSIPTDIATP